MKMILFEPRTSRHLQRGETLQYVLMRSAGDTETVGTINDMRPSTTQFLQSLHNVTVHNHTDKAS